MKPPPPSGLSSAVRMLREQSVRCLDRGLIEDAAAYSRAARYLAMFAVPAGGWIPKRARKGK